MGRSNTIDACKQYRSAKQRKIRQFKEKCHKDVHSAFLSNKSSLWRVLDNINIANKPSCNEPNISELTEKYDSQRTVYNKKHSNIEIEIINSNFTEL